MVLHVGTSGFGYKEWKGRFYPEGLRAQDMLRYYSQHFSAVEINNSFYRMPREGMLESWAEEVQPGFVFTLKAPRTITHIKRLTAVEEETARFLSIAGVLAEKIGAVLFQLPPGLRRDIAVFQKFLEILPPRTRMAFEFRNPSWLDEEVLGLLRARGFALCTADTDQNRVDEAVSTAPWGYLRLRRSGYTDQDLARWAEAIASRKEWDEAFVFFKHEESAEGPKLARRFLEIWEAGSTNIVQTVQTA